jgi:hypothetical protein
MEAFMTHTLNRVAAIKGRAPARRGPRPPAATPALLFRANFRLDGVEAEVHVLDDPARRPPPAASAAFLDGRAAAIGLDRYVPAAAGDAAPPLGHAVRLLRPNIPIARGYNHGMTVELLAAYRMPAGDPNGRPPAAPPALAIRDVTTGGRSPRSRGGRAARVGGFAREAAAVWAEEFLPPDFWAHLARLNGVRYLPAARPLAAGRATAVYLRDAAPSRWDRDDPPAYCNPRLLRTHLSWLARKGREYVGRSCERIVAAMQCSATPDELQAHLGRMFARP